MSKITWTVETPDGTVSLEKEVIDEVKFAYFLDWTWSRFIQVDENGDPAPRTPANQGKAVKAWAGQEWNNLKATVLKDRKQQAAIAAKDAVGGIE
jgi:hypothetical protein